MWIKKKKLYVVMLVGLFFIVLGTTLQKVAKTQYKDNTVLL